MNLKFALIFVLSELVCWGLGGTRLVAEDRLPVKDKPVNVLVLMTDDFSRHCVTATGGQQSRTPHIDALAKRGTVMNNTVHQGGFSGAICTCSRAMLLTGRALWSVTPNELSYKGPAQLSTADTLLPEQFRNQGWDTFATGKWHNGNDALLRGFDHAEAVTGGMLPFNIFGIEEAQGITRLRLE